jgi:hypothetical protein
MSFAQKLGKNWMKGCITVMRPSRRAPLGAPQDEGKALMALREIPHPEEAAKAAVSKDARRPIQPTMDFLPASRLIPSCKDIR